MSPTSNATPVITVRPVESIDEYRACQDVQRRTWGITEDGYVVPVATLTSVQHAGGLVLGAFAGERLLGFAFAYLGRVRGRWALYSQLAGVDPAAQDTGVGAQLKQAQRAWAREQGLALVAWTYDPLQAGNANFNLHKLGAFGRTYEVNFYGARTDALNAGLDTDRLLVEWPTDDPAADGWLGVGQEPVPLHPDTSLDGMTPLLLEVPPNIAELRAHDLAEARRRQLSVRQGFQRAFAAGYVAMDFVRDKGDEGPRTAYVLRRPVGPL